jgi:hypothetical protein
MAVVRNLAIASLVAGGAVLAAKLQPWYRVVNWNGQTLVADCQNPSIYMNGFIRAGLRDQVQKANLTPLNGLDPTQSRELALSVLNDGRLEGFVRRDTVATISQELLQKGISQMASQGGWLGALNPFAGAAGVMLQGLSGPIATGLGNAIGDAYADQVRQACRTPVF